MFLMDWFYGVLASLGLGQKEATILVLGLQNAGKRTLLHMLEDEGLVPYQPTQDPNPVDPVEFSIGNIKFKAFDFGGHQNAPRVLRDHHAKVDAVVYLIDAKCAHVNFCLSNIASSCGFYTHGFTMEEEELDELLSNELLANVPFLILGNNSDCEYAVSEDELCFRIGLNGIATGKGKVNLADTNVRPFEVFMCSIVHRIGCVEGFRWLSQYIK